MSMEAAINTLQEIAKGRRIAVLGDMLELGKGSTRYHRAVGEYVKNSKTDILLCFGKNSNYYIEGACDKGFDRANTAHFDSREELAEHLKGILQEGDAVLFKGSRGMKLEEVYEALKQA